MRQRATQCGSSQLGAGGPIAPVAQRKFSCSDRRVSEKHEGHGQIAGEPAV
jgi:hypothetical protein